MKLFASSNPKSGFSLIEILIATTILLVIVVMASMVFQQTSGAFESGDRKIKSQVALRNVVGMITRDLGQMVDSAEYDGLDGVGDFGAKRIEFLALTGEPGKNRIVQVLKYEESGGVVTRTETSVNCSKGRYSRGSSTSAALNSSDDKISIEFETEGDSFAPERVSIRASISTDVRTSSVGAGSSGRNKQFETGSGKSDDIYVGYNPNHQ